jgi:hypothetical protein
VKEPLPRRTLNQAKQKKAKRGKSKGEILSTHKGFIRLTTKTSSISCLLILTSLMRDLNRVYAKLKVVALPISSEAKHKELKQWDLWGPFIICLLLGTILCFTTKKNSGLVFSMIFIIMWIGAIIITMNSSLLGGKLTLMQCICLLGYCTFPLVLASFINRVILKSIPSFMKLLIVFVSFVWSTKGKFYIFLLIFYSFYTFYF